MPNTFAATLAALPTPQLNYVMDEASGAYLNSGNGGLADVTPQNSPLRQGPGVIRNNPLEYGLWVTPGSTIRAISAVGVAGHPVAAGWTTATISVAFCHFGPIGDSPSEGATLFSIGYRNSTTLSDATTIKLSVLNQRLYLTINRFINTAGSDWLMAISDDLTPIDDGTPYIFTVVQAADGAGIRMYLNGAEIACTTTSSGTGIDGDSWADQVLDANGVGTAGLICFGSSQSGTTGSPASVHLSHMITQRPLVWRNTALTSAQVIGLHNSAALAFEPQDYYEYMLDRFSKTQKAYYMNLGWIGGASLDSVLEGGIGVGAASHGQLSWFATRLATNQADVSRASNYPDYFSRYSGAGGQYTQTSTTSLLAANSAGTVSVLVTLNTLPGTSSFSPRPFYAFGEGTSGLDENITLHFGATSFGATIIYTAGRVESSANVTGDYYRRVYLPADTGLDLVLPHFALITLTHDGIEPRLYVNGVLINSFAESSVGTTYDATTWWDGLVSPASVRTCVQYPSSTAHLVDLDIHEFLVLGDNAALSAAAVLEHWNAISGAFAPPTPTPTPPDGGFTDTLTNTGNEGDPNGPGPDHYWRMNAASGFPPDVGISVVDGTVIATGGDPSFEVQGPLIDDPTNDAIYFDGAGDYFEVGVDGIAGALCDYPIGSLGFFIGINSLTRDHVVYSQSNDLASAFIQWGVDERKPYFVVQTSAGNSVRMEASQEVDRDYVFVVMTNDGSEYLLYVGGALDIAATITETGTGVQGDWFDTITATRTAIAARADSGFTTETTARESEIFIYDEVLTAGEIGALFNAALADGIGGNANTLGVLDFEDVTFRNGGFADVRLVNPLTAFNQVVKVKGGNFIGGAQGVDKQSIFLSGEARAQVAGNTFDLNDAPVAGRAAIHATVADPTANATTFGSLVAKDNTFNRMGRAADPAIYIEAGFGMSVQANRFFDTLGAAVGWRGDARRVLVTKNIIDTVSAGLAAIYVRASLNTQIGNAWVVKGNNIIDVAAGAGIYIVGGNSSAAEFARNLKIEGNKINNVAAEGIYLDQISDALIGLNEMNGGATEGIRIKAIKGLVKLISNSVEDHTAQGIIMDEASVQTAALHVDSNIINGLLVADGITIDNVTTARVAGNKLLNLVNGLVLGTITAALQARGNDFRAITTPLAITGTLTNPDFGENFISGDNAAVPLTVATTAVNVSSPYHTITSGSVTDLDNIGGPGRTGMVVALEMATGSSVITAKDGTGDLVLAGDFAMAAGDVLWLRFDGTAWNELSRV